MLEKKNKIKWEEILRNSIVDNKIKATYLQHIPKLKTCDNWEMVNFLGKIYYKFKYTTYDGALVKLNGKIYFINSKQIQSVISLTKWNISNEITVIE